MRVTGWVSILAVLLGAAVGVSSSWVEYGVEREFGFSKPASIESQPVGDAGDLSAGRERKSMTDGVHDFGVMSPGEVRQHTFRVRNTGTIPLTTAVPGKILPVHRRKDVSQRGAARRRGRDRTELAVERLSVGVPPDSRFGTNDPARLELDLTVKGRVQQIVRPDPIAVSLDNVLPEKSRDVAVRVFGYRDEDLGVQEVSVSASLRQPTILRQ